MAKRKQQQDAAEVDSKSIKLQESSSKKKTTLPSLWTLPEEIRAYIVRMVCARPIKDQAEDATAAPEDPASVSSHAWRVDLDVKTICSLTLVSCDFHAHFIPLLYAHVRLEKPTASQQRPVRQEHAHWASQRSAGELLAAQNGGRRRRVLKPGG